MAPPAESTPFTFSAGHPKTPNVFGFQYTSISRRIMPLDPYQTCPCGSGKKLKFCCHDLTADIEKIHRMIDGDQPHAALRHVEQTLAKHPRRSSLLDLKSQIELSLGMYDEGEQTINQLLAVDSKQATGHALRAIIMTIREDAAAAIDSLQTALEAVDRTMPVRVAEAVGTVGQFLLMTGDVFASRAHLWLHFRLVGRDDRRAIEALFQMGRYAGLPKLLRDRRDLRPLPASHAAATTMQEICDLAAVGKWRRAAEQCDQVLPDHLDEPLFFYNRALLSGYVGDTRNLIAGLRLYARQAVPYDDAIEAEALAQALDTSLDDPAAEPVQVTLPLDDESVAFERMIDSRSLVTYPIEQVNYREFDGPKPRAAFMLLDRDAPATGTGLQRDQVPSVLGLVFLFGRQTDRRERLELDSDEGEQFDASVQRLREIVGDVLGNEVERVKSADARLSDSILSWRWHLPPDTPIDERRQLMAEERRHRLLNLWVDTPRRLFGGSTPRQAAQDPAQQLTVAAAVLLLETSDAGSSDPGLFADLRQQLGLPEPGPIDPTTVDLLSLPLTRVTRLELAKLNDGELTQLYRMATLVNLPEAIQVTANELLARDSHVDGTVFEQLLSVETDTARAIELLERARQWADRKGQSHARWDLIELEIYLAEGRTEEATRVLQHITAEHRDDQAAMAQLYQLMQSLQASAPAPERPYEDAPYAPLPLDNEPGSGGIWTPDSASGRGEKQGLWLPS